MLSVNYALEKLGYAVRDVEEIKRTIGLSLKETYSALTSDTDTEKAEQFAGFFKRKADEVMTENTELYAGAKELIDIIVGAEDVKVEKPDPEGLLWTIEHLEMKNDDVLYVGDSLVDAKTAENAGTAFAGVLTGTTTREEFERYHCAYIGKNIADIFHNELANCAKNHALAQLLNSARQVIIQNVEASPEDIPSTLLEKGVEWHEKIIQAIKDRDEEIAVRLMEEYLITMDNKA